MPFFFSSSRSDVCANYIREAANHKKIHLVISIMTVKTHTVALACHTSETTVIRFPLGWPVEVYQKTPVDLKIANNVSDPHCTFKTLN